MNNPYTAPAQNEFQEGGEMNLNERSYSVGQMMCGTFFGSLLCSAFMVKKNYSVFGSSNKGVKTFWIFIGIAVVIIGLSVFLPTNLPGLILTVISMFALSKWHAANMAGDQKKFEKLGGKRQSNWKVFGLIMASIGIIIGLALVAGIVIGLTNPKLLE